MVRQPVQAAKKNAEKKSVSKKKTRKKQLTTVNEYTIADYVFQILSQSRLLIIDATTGIVAENFDLTSAHVQLTVFLRSSVKKMTAEIVPVPLMPANQTIRTDSSYPYAGITLTRLVYPSMPLLNDIALFGTEDMGSVIIQSGAPTATESSSGQQRPAIRLHHYDIGEMDSLVIGKQSTDILIWHFSSPDPNAGYVSFKTCL